MLLLQADRAWTVTLWGTITLYVVLSVADARATRPIPDEAWFASPAVNLVKHGHMGTSVIDPMSTGLTQIDRYTYWVMPLHLLAQALWYKVAGISLQSVRTLSLLWGFLGLWAWFVIVRHLSSNRHVALLAVILIALDLVFISQSASGRMDIMCAALGFAGIATYLSLRERNLTTALLTSHVFAAASVFTHPNGIFASASLAFLALYFDRKRLQWKHLIFAAPYVLAAGLWGLYILQAPATFVSQLTANVAGLGNQNAGWMRSGRFAGLLAPWASIKAELTQRYLPVYGFAPDATTGGRLKMLVPALFLTGIVGCLLSTRLRRHRGAKVLLLMALLYFAGETFLNFKLHFYLVHVTPFYCAILAWWLHESFHTRTLPRPLLLALLAAFLSIQVATSLSVAFKRQYQTIDRPAIEYLMEHAKPPALIIGATQFAFDLGLEGNILTDDSLGYFSGRKADFILLSAGENWLAKYENTHPEAYEYVVAVLANEYRRVYVGPCCEIFARYSPLP